VLVTLDTTRADHLSAYGYDQETTPRLTALAADGVLFRRAYCNMPTTDPSHASILTGLYPRRHGITRNGQRAMSGLPSLAASLQARGYSTAAFLSRRHLDPRELGIPGFDLVDAPSSGKERRAEETGAAAVRWLSSQEDGAYFLWVHLFDPHSPYDPPPPFRSRLGDGPPERRLGNMGWLVDAVRHPPETSLNNIRLYDSEISYADEWLGRIVEAARALPGDPPLFVVTGDHGESLDDLEARYAYAFAHGEFLYEHQTRVPLVISWKGELPGGRTSDALIQSVDVAPTILDLLHVPIEGSIDGVSRVAVALGHDDEGAGEIFIERRSFKEPEQPWLAGSSYAVVSGSTKLIVDSIKGDELFDLRSDPAEAVNLAASDPSRLKEMKDRIARWIRTTPLADAEGEASDEKLRDLRALGYVN
jgi:arylsulfatase A-like enzyme